VQHTGVGDTLNHKASSGLRYIINPPCSTARVHQHLNIGQGEVAWDDFFGTLAEVGFDGIMTACVFAWEDRADESGRSCALKCSVTSTSIGRRSDQRRTLD